MMLVAFRSKLTGAAGDDYARMAEAMEAHAKTFPGFVEVKDYLARDGERLTLVWWQDAQTLHAWATDARHRVAQATGREKWYEYYKMDVAEITRVSNFERKPVA
jgi:heme-degrading monooxygenase HmoA